jgi:hypothetical protein
MYTCNVHIVNHFYFPEAFLKVKKLMEKTYSGTEQNMSEKQGKGPELVDYSKKFLILSSALLGKMPCNFLSDLDSTTLTS